MNFSKHKNFNIPIKIIDDSFIKIFLFIMIFAKYYDRVSKRFRYTKD
jgi:hypothetical protein